jgi:ABC-type oligopeptide transport system ATPase subunit
MKDGRIVEQGEADSLYLHPETAYTKGLINAIPTLINS